MKTTDDYIGRFEEDFYADMNTAFIKNMRPATKEIKPITKVELAEMFDISIEQFEKEFQDGTIVCTAENDKLIRDATLEEQQSIEKYINSISKPTGVNFFDFYD